MFLLCFSRMARTYLKFDHGTKRYIRDFTHRYAEKYSPNWEDWSDSFASLVLIRKYTECRPGLSKTLRSTIRNLRTTQGWHDSIVDSDWQWSEIGCISTFCAFQSDREPLQTLIRHTRRLYRSHLLFIQWLSGLANLVSDILCKA